MIWKRMKYEAQMAIEEEDIIASISKIDKTLKTVFKNLVLSP